MKANKYAIILLIVMGIISTQSCKKESGNNVINISKHNSTKSTGMSGNCMNCHKSGGTGDGWFSIAGTIFDSGLINPSPNGTVIIYDGPNGAGNMIATIEVDASGNFFTTESVDFSGGLYPSVISTSGQSSYMSASVNTGDCNSCHGITVDRIFVN